MRISENERNRKLSFREEPLSEVRREAAPEAPRLLGDNLARLEARKGPETVGGGTPALVTVIGTLLHIEVTRSQQLGYESVKNTDRQNPNTPQLTPERAGFR